MMSSTMSMFTRPSSGSSPASNPTTPIRMITTPTTPAYVLAMFFRPPCKDRSSTQSPAATAEKLPDSLTFLTLLLSDGPLRRLEADLRMGTVAEWLRCRSPATTQRYRLVLRAEPGDIIIRFVLTQHVPRRGRTLIQRVLPVLHADPPLEHQVVVVGHVTRRVDPLHARPAKFIDHDTVVDLRAGICEQLRDRLDAEAHHDKVALNSAAALGHDPLHAIGAFKGGHCVLEDQRRFVVAVDPFDHPADLFTKDPTQRHLVAIHDDDINARLPKRRRYLRANKAHPHHHRLAPRANLRADTFAVGHRAQVV